MSKKIGKIAAIIGEFRGRELDAHYLAFFDCFNRQLFFEAHEVLESLWLADRHGANGAFYKGLIQLAGAFVHLQKGRLRPAAALFCMAETNLKKYPALHEQLDVGNALKLMRNWVQRLEQGGSGKNLLASGGAPKLVLRH